MDSIDNVIKYMSNDNYDDNRIINDIDETISLFFKDVNNPNMYELKKNIDFYITGKVYECSNFLDMLLLNDCPSEYRNILMHYFLPFSHSKNPMADKRLFERLFEVNNYYIDQLIMDLLMNVYNINANKKILNDIYYFFRGEVWNSISFDGLGKSPLLGNIDKIPLYRDEIINKYLAYKENNSIDNYTKIIANYGELLYYMRLMNSCNGISRQQIMWVSRDLGDGYGYDIAWYDGLKNFLHLYEIKTQSRDKYYNYITLTENEESVCDILNAKRDHDYHIIKVYLGDKIELIDIDPKNNMATNILEPEKPKKLTREKGVFNLD